MASISSLEPSPSSSSKTWASITQFIKSATNKACGYKATNLRSHLISHITIDLFEARRQIPVDKKPSASGTKASSELKRSLVANRDAFWVNKATEMEATYASENISKLF